MTSLASIQGIPALLARVSAIGGPFQVVVAAASFALLLVALVPQMRPWRGWALLGMTALLLIGEGVLVWFHWRLYQMAVVVDPTNGQVTGHIAVSMWVEGERLYMWALMVALLGVAMRRHRDELLQGTMIAVAVLAAAGVLLGQPFTNPLPDFLSQYSQYVQAMAMGGSAASGAFQGMEATRQFYYNAWFMWVHPPLLFFSYGAFVLAFVATVQMVVRRHSALRDDRVPLGASRIPGLTAGMLLGFPWALEAWQGEAWWWSGFVNMSIMMWLLYTAYLHARLYLRRQGMWKAVAVLAILSFLVLVLTYVATYVVPGRAQLRRDGPRHSGPRLPRPPRGHGVMASSATSGRGRGISRSPSSPSRCSPFSGCSRSSAR